jgi:methyl-accepting chemotaxis protein
MKKSIKTFGNILFPLFCIIGCFLIFKIEVTEKVNPKFFIPTAIIFLYALIIFIITFKSDDFEMADHFAETIYFIGFLYTLFALFTLLYKIGVNFEKFKRNEESIIYPFFFVGISVTTTMAGVLLRNMVKSSFLKRNPQNEDDLLFQRIEELKKYSEQFTNVYSGVFKSMQEFIDERKTEIEHLSVKEKEYINSLDKFNNTIDAFCNSLSLQENELKKMFSTIDQNIENQQKYFSSVEISTNNLSDSVRKIKNEIQDLNFVKVSNEMSELSKEINELDSVLDSLIKIIENKVENIN